jgi:hypothetical protein
VPGANASTPLSRAFRALHIRTLDPSIEFSGRGMNLRTETLNPGQRGHSDHNMKPGAKTFLANLDR